MSEGKILVSGVKPTGRPHIGNYFGAMKQFVELQDSYESYVFIADLHALTSIQNKDELELNTLGVILDYLAIGLDPKHVVLYKQSDVPQVTELAWIFNCLTTMPYLMRAHAFKDAEAKNKEINVGLFDYPMLMAADILIQDANLVPVGPDQKQHIEIARDTSQKFNNTFGELFTLPEPRILEGISNVKGVDGQKMSKSYNNMISLFATDDEIEKKVMSIVTGTGGVLPEVVHSIHELIIGEITNNFTNPESSPDDFYNLYTDNKSNYKLLKEVLIEDMKKFIGPIREKRLALEKDRSLAVKILNEGGSIARDRAEKKMEEVRKKVGLKLS